MRHLLFFAALLSAAITNAQTFDWAKRMGGTSYDFAYAMVMDDSGNTYTTGRFSLTVDFDPGLGVFNLTAGGFHDVFISKLDAAGNFVWAKNMGGSGDDEGFAITLDTAGNIYTTGTFEGTSDFDPGAGVFNISSVGFKDIFISKLDAAGNFVWAKAIGGPSSDYNRSIALDDSGNVYTTSGFVNTVDFDPGPGVFNLTSAGQNDIFICKLDTAGNFVWVKQMGAVGTDAGYCIAFDTTGNIYIGGHFKYVVDFDPGPGVFNLTEVSGSDIFILKLDAAGNFVWAKQMAGAAGDWVRSMAIDDIGNVYSTGWFAGTCDFDPGPGVFNLTAVGADTFISKLDSAGNFVWAKQIEGIINHGNAIALDAFGNVYTSGYFSGNTTDFDPGVGTFNLLPEPQGSIFISKLDTGGNFGCAIAMGGPGSEQSTSVAVDDSGNVYTAGYFQLTADFDPGVGVYDLTSAGLDDIFIAKYKVSLTPVATASNDTTMCLNDSVNLSASGGTGYLWLPGGSLNDSTIANPLASPAVTTTYTVIVSSGCESDTAYVTITVIQSYSFFGLPVTICNGDSTLLYGNYETTSGTYYEYFTAVNGCDSVFSTVLAVNTVDTSVTKSVNLISSNANGAIYQWYDCNSNSIIVGETGQLYVVVSSGSYAVIVTQNGCTDTSSCYTFTIGIVENSSVKRITIYPNPTTGVFTVQGAKGEIQVYDLFGRLVLRSTEQRIDMREFAKGMYVVKLLGNEETYIQKLILE